MKKTVFSISTLLLCIALLFSHCGASNTAKGTGVGAGTGAALGAGLGALLGGGKGAAWGAGIGAALGGASGAIIGKKMDKQKEELAQIEGLQVESMDDGKSLKATFSSGILFATGKSELNYGARSKLDELATSLVNNPDTDIKIYGHTDSTGSDAINNPLSQRRAESVYRYLMMRGVNGRRMHAQGFGSYEPVADNSTEWGRQQNRRVEILLLPGEKMIRDAQQGK